MLVEVPCAYFTRVHSCVCEATFAEVGSRKRSTQKIAATLCHLSSFSVTHAKVAKS